jgi:hypothetical protein
MSKKARIKKSPLSMESPQGQEYVREVRKGAVILFQNALALSEADARKCANSVVKLIVQNHTEAVAL